MPDFPEFSLPALRRANPVTAPDAIIVGAGPAGSAAAIGLARAGARVLVLEKARETGDALCGGFLSWQTILRLDALGVSRDELGGAPVGRVRLIAGKWSSDTQLPDKAMGLSRRRLDRLLQAAAERMGASIERGVHASMFEDGTIVTRDGARLEAPSVFLAAGKHGFRGQGREPAPRLRGDPVIGLRLRMPATAGLRALVGDAVELHLFDRGYAGLLLQEDASANLCLAVHKSRLDGAGGDPAGLLRTLGEALPALGERLAHADWSQPVDAIGHVPYGWRAHGGPPGLFRLGDQAGVIPSLAGEGIGIAIASAAASTRAWQHSGPAGAADFQEGLRARMARPFAIAGLAWRAGETAKGAAALTLGARIAPPLVRWVSRATRISGE